MKVTVWVNYGLEGWKPEDFDSEEKAIEYILNGPCNKIRITRELTLKLIPNIYILEEK